MTKRFFIIFFILIFFCFNFVYSDDCGIGDASCEVESMGSSFDSEIYDMSKDWYDMLFFDSNSMLRTGVFLDNDLANYLNDIMLSILVIFFQIWTYYVLFLFYSTNGDLEKIAKAKDSLKRLIMAILLISIVGSLFALFDGFMSAINSTVGLDLGIREMLSPDPIVFGDNGGWFSAFLRIFVMLISFFLGLIILLSKMALSLVFPLFTLFIFLTFVNKKALAEFIIKILIFAELLPAIFFLTMAILHSILATVLSFGDPGLKITIVSGGIAMIATSVLFFVYGVGLVVGYFTKSFMFMMGEVMLTSITTSFRRGFKYLSNRRRM